jgi:hypothetical protein
LSHAFGNGAKNLFEVGLDVLKVFDDLESRGYALVTSNARTTDSGTACIEYILRKS